MRQVQVALRLVAGVLSLVLLSVAYGALSGVWDPEQDNTDTAYLLFALIPGVPGLVVGWLALRGWRWEARRQAVVVLLGTAVGALGGGAVQMAFGTEQICLLTQPPTCGPVEHFAGDFFGVGMLLGGIVGFATAASWAAVRGQHAHR